MCRFKNLSVFCFLLLSIFILGCSKEDQTDWTITPTFKYEDSTFYGVDGKVGFIRDNGEENEPDFPENQGRLYRIYLFEANKNLLNKEVKITATSKETGDTEQLSEFINHGINPQKLGFGPEGLWKIDVIVEDKEYSSFIIKTEKP